MPNTPKSHRLKRKRGKKFVYRDGQPAVQTEAQSNPFEEHSKSKAFARDLEKRQQLLQEYRKLGNNSSIVDQRLAEKSSKLSEDDKMKLRYIAEQKQGISSLLKTSRRKEKFNLDSSDEDGGDIELGGFTHKGRPLVDDFNEKIEHSSDEEGPGHGNGKLTEDVVKTMNFGGGSQPAEERKKTQKEIYDEIIEKSKAFKEAKQELKQMNQELIQELNDDFEDIRGLLTFNRDKGKGPAESADPKIKAIDTKGKSYDSVATCLKLDARMAAPTVKVQTEHDIAAQKKRKLQEQLLEQEKSGALKKREQKMLDKREQAMEKMMKEQADETKHERQVQAATDSVARQVDKARFDDDLQSSSDQSQQEEFEDEESGEYSHDEDEEMEESDD